MQGAFWDEDDDDDNDDKDDGDKLGQRLCGGRIGRFLLPAAAVTKGRRGLPHSVVVIFVVLVQRRFSTGRGKDDSDNGVGDTLVTPMTMTTYNDKMTRTIT